MTKIIFLLLVLVSLPGFCEDDDLEKEIKEDRARSAQTTPSLEEEANDMDLANEAMKYRKTQQRAHQNIQKANEALMIHKQIEALTKDGWSAAKVMDKKLLEMFQKLLATGILSEQPRAAVRAHLEERVKGTRIENFVKRFPVFLDIMTDIMRDKDALPGLIRILEKRETLQKYGMIWLSILIFGFIFRRKVLNKATETMGFFKRNFVNLGVTLFFTAVSTLIFYFMFKPDIHPTFAIIGKNLFS